MRAFAVRFLVSTVFLAGVVACSSGSDNASSSKVTTTTSPSAPSTTASTKSSTIASNHCSTEQLKGSMGETQAGAGQRYTALVLTNTGAKACELRGFPGVSLLDANGTQIGQPASREGAEGTTISIAPGATASATLHTSAAGIGSACDPASTQIKVFPPDNTASLTFAASYVSCGGFRVGTLVSGSTGN